MIGDDMKLTKEQALHLLEEGGRLNPGRWIEHSKRVGEAAGRIAKVLNLDVEKAETLGYIHDIGKRFGLNSQHTIDGYEYLIKLGYDEEYVNICLTHSYLNHDIDCTAGGYPNPKGYGYEFRKEFMKNHEYTIYEEIINLCDLFCTDRFMTIEKRMIDIYLRRGVHGNTVYHLQETFKLKEKLENQIKCPLYSLFPEITEDINHLMIDPTFGLNTER